MMKLSPRRYGGAVYVPPYPSGNVWLGVEAGGTYLYDWNFVASATGFTPSGFIPTYALKVGAYLYYLRTADSKIAYAPDSDPGNTLTITPIAANGQMLATDGTYIYYPGGINRIERMTLPTGSLSDISGTNLSRANTIICLGGKIFVASIYRAKVTRSNDLAVNWTLATNDFATAGSFTSPNLAADPSGSRIFILYKITATNVFEIKYSDDDGDTWSSVVYTFTDATDSLLNANSFVYMNGAYWIITNKGKSIRSTDGITGWTSGATIPYDVTQVSHGIGKTIAICGFNRIYETTDNGATWTLVTLPTAPTGSASDRPQTVWIGDPP